MRLPLGLLLTGLLGGTLADLADLLANSGAGSEAALPKFTGTDLSMNFPKFRGMDSSGPS
jgi:hypothetical protein